MFNTITNSKTIRLSCGYSNCGFPTALLRNNRTFHTKHESGVRTPGIQITSTISISKSLEGRGQSGTNTKSETVSQGTPYVSKETLYSSPVRGIVARVETSQVTNRKGNVREGLGGKIIDWTNSLFIGKHLRVIGLSRKAKGEIWRERSLDWMGVSHLEARKSFIGIMRLVQSESLSLTSTSEMASKT